MTEKAVIVEEMVDGRVIIQRAEGDLWVLDPKVGWCKWAYKYEGRQVDLEFGNKESTITNDQGESCVCYTEKPL